MPHYTFVQVGDTIYGDDETLMHDGYWKKVGRSKYTSTVVQGPEYQKFRRLVIESRYQMKRVPVALAGPAIVVCDEVGNVVFESKCFDTAKSECARLNATPPSRPPLLELWDDGYEVRCDVLTNGMIGASTVHDRLCRIVFRGSYSESVTWLYNQGKHPHVGLLRVKN